MITWVMVGLLLAAETTCGRDVRSGNGNEDSKQKTSGVKITAPDDEEIYRKLITIILNNNRKIFIPFTEELNCTVNKKIDSII